MTDNLKREPFHAKLRGTHSFLVRADISRFYESIYTHTIPWAIDGKVAAKASRGRGGLLGDRFDSACQRMQDGQTVGIPIGPDTSIVISEILLTAVDEMLASQLPRGATAFHWVDDYYVGCDSASEGEEILTLLAECFAAFELALNPIKSKVIALPSPMRTIWNADLRAFRFLEDESWQYQRSRFVDYFDKAATLARSYPEQSVFGYATGRLRNIFFYEKNAQLLYEQNWKLLEYLLMQSVLSEPDIMKSVLPLVLKYQHFGLERDAWTKVLNTMVDRYSRYGLTNDVAWTLWAAICLDVSLAAGPTESISKVNDCSVALLALDARNRGLMDPILDTSLWQSALGAGGLFEEHWLLAYEAQKKGWLRPKSGRDTIASDPSFSFLRARDVYFYDEDVWTYIESQVTLPPVTPAPEPAAEPTAEVPEPVSAKEEPEELKGPLFDRLQLLGFDVSPG